MRIRRLPKETYQGYSLTFQYTTNSYYNVVIQQEPNWSVTLVKEPLEKEIEKHFVDTLYPAYFENAEAFGYFAGDTLQGVLEVNLEEWSKRLRITELLVCKEYRKQGIGKALIEHAISLAREKEARMLVLETQSCNVNAISFYQKMGFDVIGMDTSCYTNNDIENKEVRLEMGMYITTE